MKIQFASWILLTFPCVAQRDNSSLLDNFQHALCSQDKGFPKEITCENIHYDEDFNKEVSIWPPGPYALPMSVYGCPEGQSYGWHEGYLSITLRNTSVFFTTSGKIDSNGKDTTKPENDKEGLDWPDINKYVFQPFTRNTIDIHFCFKSRRNETVDTGIFPVGNYSIYADRSGCREEFVVSEKNITIPEIDHWTSDGYLPNFNIQEYESYAILKLSLCVMFTSSPNATKPSQSDSPFVLIKNDKEDCPNYAEMSGHLDEESLYLNTRSSSNTTMLTHLQTYCCNYPERWKTPDIEELFHERIDMAFTLSKKLVTNGNTSINMWSQDAHLTERISVFQLIGLLYGKQVYLPWKIIDLGRTYMVSSARLKLSYATNIDIKSFPTMHCFISREKWSFLYSRSLKCPFIQQYNSEQRYINILFLRPIAGRYLTLVGRADDSPLRNASSVDVFTQHVFYDSKGDCNTDLGMADGGIENFQINSSSSDSNLVTWEARPYHRGWCAEVNDNYPYIMIDFIRVVWLEGLSIWNWKTSTGNDNIAFPKEIRFGVMEFKLSYGVSFTNLSAYGRNFRLQSYRLDAEESTFWFLKPFEARYLRLLIIEPYTRDLNCLKFEIHGCAGINSATTMFQASQRQKVMSNVQHFYGEGFISNPGYPNFYKNGQDYKWVIRSDSDYFIALIFTNISLHLNKNAGVMDSCLDRILVSKYLLEADDKLNAIDHRLDGHVFMVETSESVVILSFVTCILSERKADKAGFQVIVRNQDKPTCFSLDSSMKWENGRREECHMSPMNLKSMSYLGLPFIGTVEEWTIRSQRKRIKMYIKDFRVPCIKDGKGSEFKMTESAYERTYCNLNRPPDVMYSLSDTVVVSFQKNEELPLIRYTVGFWLRYYIKDVSLEHLIDFQAVTSNLTNVALNKPAVMSSNDVNTPSAASNGNDGFHRTYFQTDYTYRPYQPWWMVDLQETYKIKFLALFYRIYYQSERSKVDKRNIEIYTGFEDDSLLLTGFHCGALLPTETIPLHDIHTRFVKLNYVYLYNNLFRLYEVEVYGELDYEIDEYLRYYYKNRTEEKIASFEAYTSHTGPYKCPQTDMVMLRTISVQEISIKGDNSKTGQENSDYSMWSEWTECSVQCGIGTKERKRVCLKNTSCLSEDTHLQKCVGNGSCPVCVKAFNKCYSFFPELTNWQQAGMECWRRYMTLVSIHSLEELRFIKYKLREKRHRDLPAVIKDAASKFNASYFAHIGLSRMDAKHTDKLFLWEDRSPVIFLAWIKGEPATGSCVRMNYQYYEPDNTWEAEDCTLHLADYFVCEKPITNTDHDIIAETHEIVRFTKYGNDWKEIYEQIRTSEYKGNVNITKAGQECLQWAPMYPPGIWFPDGAEKEENYCRDPNESGSIWCYVDSERYHDNRACTTTLPAVENPRFSVLKYMGTWNRTYAGRECKRWNQFAFEDTDFAGETQDLAKNYCRDPFQDGYLWCYTTDPDYSWEPCIIANSALTTCQDAWYKYRGQQNSSFSGKECLRWHNYEHFLKQNKKKIQFPDASISDAETYCRDPFADGYAWCYIGNTTWEPCYVSDMNLPDTLTPKSNESTVMFQCKNGELIPARNQCDEKFDCTDLSDETECWLNTTSHLLIRKDNVSVPMPGKLEVSSYYQCGSLEWVSVLSRCDQVKDCADASDETGCLNYLTKESDCGWHEFRCGDGDCIHISQMCNHVVDCLDLSDEYCDFGSCLIDEYQCDNGECIALHKKCDGAVHCIDGTDEGNCEICNMEKAFHCDVVKCISKRLVCDTYADCEDGSDESECYVGGFASCQDIWAAGYRQTGPFKIRGIDVICNFDSVLSSNRLKLYVMNRDLYWTTFDRWEFPDSSFRAYTYVRQGQEMSDGPVEAILNVQWDACYFKTIQTCSTVHNAIMEFDDQFYKNAFGSCSCNKLTVECLSGCSGGIRRCRISSHTTTLTRSVSNYHNGQIYSVDALYTPHYEILADPITCSYGFHASGNVLVCENDVKVIPNHLKCLYDTDSSGIIIGCRSASHLKECETFKCPKDTAKCPGSYCIPIRFVCDGEVQCPGGQDEEGCGCRPEKNEVVILADNTFTAVNNVTLFKFAKQFNTDRNIVRLLTYELLTPLEHFGIDTKVLQISDQQILPFSAVNRLAECRYATMADKFLSTIKFTEKVRGIIFFESDAEGASVAKSIFANSTTNRRSGTHLYRLLERRNVPLKSQNIYDHVYVNTIPKWERLRDTGAAFFPELCRATSKIDCSNGYKCSSSKMCISLDKICDGQRQCVHGEDEQICEFICPVNCSCSGSAVNCSSQDLDTEAVATFPLKTRQLDISWNTNLTLILQKSYLDMKLLVRLNVSYCNIRNISEMGFAMVYNLMVLDLSYNEIRILYNNVFKRLQQLTSLYMHGSYKLVTIEPGAFKGLSHVHELQLVGTKLRRISAYTFSGLTLKYVDFSNNTINSIEDFAFDDLSVEKIDFEFNPVKGLHRKIFSGVRNLKQLKTSAYKFCCIRPTYLLEEDCFPPKDEFSSCEDLMRLSALQTMLWLVGISALIGNFLSIMYRLKYDRERLKIGYGIFVTNLAAADFMMGVYLIIIAIADAVYRKRYIFVDESWRNSAYCTFAGVVSTVSSEASVLFLCLITLDRLFVIKFPFGQVRFGSVKAHVCSIFAWLLSLFLAVLPVVNKNYFQEKFYSRSGVCIALPLTRDRPPGWEYSVIVFVGLNFVTFVLVAFGQCSIFMEVRKSSSRMKKMQSTRRKDLTVARNLLLVVTTDFMCWFPIGVMGMMALNGHVISGDVYAWSAVFILPINSALNPILYTLSAIVGKTKFNPSTDEQERTELSTELGKYIKEYQSICQMFNVRSASKRRYKRLASVLESDVQVLPSATLTFAFKLFKGLDILQRASLIIGNIDKNTVFVGESRGKFHGKLHFKTEPFFTPENDDLRNDIVQSGKLINALLRKCIEQKQEK